MLKYRNVYELIAKELQAHDLEIDFDDNGLCIYDLTDEDYPLNFLGNLNVINIGSTINPGLCNEDDEFYGVYVGLLDNRYLLTFRMKINNDDGSVTEIEVADLSEYENIISKAMQCLTDEIKNYTVIQLKDLYDHTVVMAGSVEDRKNALRELKSKADLFFYGLIENIK